MGHFVCILFNFTVVMERYTREEQINTAKESTRMVKIKQKLCTLGRDNISNDSTVRRLMTRFEKTDMVSTCICNVY